MVIISWIYIDADKYMIMILVKDMQNFSMSPVS